MKIGETDWLADRFEENRALLRGVAYRMLGSSSGADDAVQEAWLRVSRAGATGVDNLGGWLTTVVARVCLDMLRSRRSRREEPLDAMDVDVAAAVDEREIDPEQEALLGDSVGLAMLVVLDTLAPLERVAFVLHDMFGVPFDEIGPVVGRSPAAARQLASRARRKVRGAGTADDAEVASQREIVDAFLGASRRGDFDALLAVLAPDVVARADGAATRMGASREVRGAATVAETFAGRARAARLALVDGAPGLVWMRRGQPQVVFEFAVSAGRIARIDLVAERLGRLELELLPT